MLLPLAWRPNSWLTLEINVIFLILYFQMKSSKIIFLSGVGQLLGVKQSLGVAPEHWSTLFWCIFYTILHVFTILYFICTIKDVSTLKKRILTSVRHLKHLYAGWNTQHKCTVIRYLGTVHVIFNQKSVSSEQLFFCEKKIVALDNSHT